MLVKNEIKEFIIDLFCGAGGTSTGIHLADCDSVVTACVNHDKKAIESHRLNHPWAKHFIEDIRNPEVVFFLKLRVDALRRKYPGCIITIWASLECTNFSKAKGGMPRKADSRTLANHLPMYLELLDPDYLQIENVMEFMSWGPLDVNGKPESKKKGIDYLKWVDTIKSFGYNFDWEQLNAADFGAYTSRSRYFAQFAKKGLPIAWPQKTHTKSPSLTEGLFPSNLKKWKPVKDVLNLDNEGVSIFDRKKPLVDNTLKRIYAGLVKFVANGDDSFIKKYFSGRPEGKVISVDGPAGTITTANGQAIVKCDFIQRYYSGNDMQRNHSINEPAGVVRTNNCMALVNANFMLKYNSTNKNGKHVPPSINEPCPTVAVQGRLGIINANFLQSYYGNGNAHSVLEPCPTVSTKDRFASIAANFIEQQYGNSKPKSIEEPLNTITNNPKFGYVTAKHFLFNPQFSNPGNSIEKPAPTIIARQDKKPLAIIACEKSNTFSITINDGDTDIMIKIKQFMAFYGIYDIKMRMLQVDELLRIQGFPKGYQLVGNQTDQKKFIGNSVEVTVAKKINESHFKALEEHFNNQLICA